MGKTLIVSDSKGNIVFTRNGDSIDYGDFTVLIATIPEGKVLTGVNPETNEPVFEDIPKSETELLREENEQLKNSLADLWEVVLLGGVE